MEWQPITDEQRNGDVILCWFERGYAVDAFFMDGEWLDPRDLSQWEGEPTHWLHITPPNTA